MDFSWLMKEHQSFLQDDPTIFFSPGRVNLIGEHIDYLGGNVFPTAISLGTYALVTKRSDNEFHFLSHNFRQYGKKVVSLHDLSFDNERNWANYCTGMIQALQSKGLQVTHGLNILIYGTLPNGAGLSSSASLEVLMGVLLQDYFGQIVSQIELVQIAQSVENHYIGVNCGIMDQFAVGMSQKNHAIYLNTNTLQYELVPLVLKDYTILIANTNKKRALSESKYNERRRECEVGLHTIQRLYPSVNDLCELEETTLHDIEPLFDNEVLYRRVRHAITENERTKQAVIALKKNDIETFSQLMNGSHHSLQYDYEVSCHELDVLVSALQQHGAIGARMTGAGFGGCAVAIVPNDIVETVIKKVATIYQENTKYVAQFYRCDTSDGARKMKEDIG